MWCSITPSMSYFNFHPGALVLFRKHVVRALELGFYTSRRCTVQLNQTQPSPRTVLLPTELLLSGTDDSSVTWLTSFKLQQCCHYFVSNPCMSVDGMPPGRSVEKSSLVMDASPRCVTLNSDRPTFYKSPADGLTILPHGRQVR